MLAPSIDWSALKLTKGSLDLLEDIGPVGAGGELVEGELFGWACGVFWRVGSSLPGPEHKKIPFKNTASGLLGVSTVS